MLKIFSYTIALFCIVSCSSSVKLEYDYLDVLSTDTIFRCEIDIVDTIIVDARATSMQGTWDIIDNKFFFADENIVRILLITLDRKIERKIFSEGRGQNEFLYPPLSFVKLHGGKFIYADKNQNIFLLDKDMNKQKDVNLISGNLPFNGVSDYIQNLLKNPDPECPAMYEMCFQGDDIIEFNNFLVFPVTTEHVKYNGYIKTILR